MKTCLHIVLFLFSGITVLSQGSAEINELLRNADENVYVNPNQSIRISEQILRSSSDQNNWAQAHLNLSKSFFIIGNYKEAINHFYLSKNLSHQSQNNRLKTDVSIHGIQVFRFLHFYELVKKFENEISRLPPQDFYYDRYKRWFEADSLREFKVLKELNTISETESQNEKNDFLFLNIKVLNSIGNISASKKDADSAYYYFNEGLQLAESFQKDNFYEMILLIDYSHFLFEIKEYEKAIDNLLKAESISAKFNNPFYEVKIFEQLTQNYLAIENNDRLQEYYIKTNNTSLLLTAQENIASNTIFNVIQNNHNKHTSILSKTFANSRRFFTITLVFAVLIWLTIKWFVKIKLNHSRDVTNYLKLIKGFEKKEGLPKKSILKITNIPKKTEKAILSKLEKFEKGNKYIAQDMSLAQLATQFETNTKYISEVINKHKGKNFNLYINEMRIEYIVNKLKTDPNYLNYKVSYLAEECGFSSHSSFATVFKSITGISPNVFIELLKKDLKDNKKSA